MNSKRYFSPTSLLLWMAVALGVQWIGCSTSDEQDQVSGELSQEERYHTLTQKLMRSGVDASPFILKLEAVDSPFYLPALQSFAHATYNELWVIIGGRTTGFHGTSDSPTPFLATGANDSMYVIDPRNKVTYGCQVPKEYMLALSATNPEFFQEDSILYLCGGYTVSDSRKTYFNTTSDQLFKINLPNLIQYIRSGGEQPNLSQVFTGIVQSEFVQVTGGELLKSGDYFYLIGGQNYQGTYQSGSTKDFYTNAVRRFTLADDHGVLSIQDQTTITDSANLHRRDFTLVPYLSAEGLDAIILGGAFTPQDLSYNNPVYLTGLSSGQPTIKVGTMEQQCNQYTCANIPILLGPNLPSSYFLIGGISMMQYNEQTHQLDSGDQQNGGRPMPFSNVVDYFVSTSDSTVEYVQLPPDLPLPGYLGSNAAFFPLPGMLSQTNDKFLDMGKLSGRADEPLLIGYMYGGIVSLGATSGTTANGTVSTFANPVLYKVNLTVDSVAMKAILTQ